MGRITEILMSQQSDKPKIGRFLKELRIKFSLNQEEICKKIGISRPTLNKIENNKAEITLLQAKKLADFYNITILDIINCEDRLEQNIRISLNEDIDKKDEQVVINGKRFNLINELIV